MTPADWVILLLAVACVAGGIGFARRRKKRGKTGCGGGCGGCPYSASCVSAAPARVDVPPAKEDETCQKPPTAV